MCATLYTRTINHYVNNKMMNKKYVFFRINKYKFNRLMFLNYINR